MKARALALLAALGSSGCTTSVTFFEVTRSPLEECEIFPQGAFCAKSGDADTADELSAPVVETWSVEIRDDKTFVFADGEVWVADGFEKERTVEKRSVVTRDPGPCTTTTERVLTFEEDGVTLSGTLEVQSRLEGPEACGETPRGASAVYELSGAAQGTP